MHRGALPLLLLVACASAQNAGEHLAVETQPFTSRLAIPLDFELDGRLEADTQDSAAVRALIKAQLLFTIGQLNADRSVGRLGLLDLSEIHATKVEVAPEPGGADAGDADAADAAVPPPPRYAVSYHARLPVAWGGATKPTQYTFKLPARVAEPDQNAFAAKYGATCVDPTSSPADASHMFVVYQPQRSGCTMAPEDVETFTASVTPSAEHTQGKYPEYHRVWQDDALHVVALFTREFSSVTADDGGALAYDAFASRMRAYLAVVQPDAAKRLESPSAEGGTTLRFAAELPDGRSMTVDMRLVGTNLDDEGPAFDDWYDGLTPSADIILQSGHAGLGTNVRALMRKGSFRSGQYLVWFANGCDTLAYVDRTLSDRRAPLNPDDPTGTKYLDTVTNVMAGHFGDLEATAATFLRAFVEVRYPEIGPKTYEQILGEIDPTQVAVVTGEEDNELSPLPPSRNPPGPPPDQPSAAAVPPADFVPPADERGGAEVSMVGNNDGDGGCSVSVAVSRDAEGLTRLLGAFGVLLVALARRRARSWQCASADHASTDLSGEIGRFRRCLVHSKVTSCGSSFPLAPRPLSNVYSKPGIPAPWQSRGVGTGMATSVGWLAGTWTVGFETY